MSRSLRRDSNPRPLPVRGSVLPADTSQEPAHLDCSIGTRTLYRGRVLIVIGTRQDDRIVGIFETDRLCRNYEMQIVDACDLTPAPEVEVDLAVLEQERREIKAKMAAVREMLKRVREAR